MRSVVAYCLLIAYAGVPVGCGNPATPSPAPTVEARASELDLFQGEWMLVAKESGLPATEEEKAQLKSVRFRFKGDSLLINDSPDRPGIAAKIALNSTSEPKSFDMTTGFTANGSGLTTEGIYKFEGDLLVLAMAQPKEARPKDFTAKAPKGGKGGVMVTRLKEVQ